MCTSHGFVAASTSAILSFSGARGRRPEAIVSRAIGPTQMPTAANRLRARKGRGEEALSEICRTRRNAHTNCISTRRNSSTFEFSLHVQHFVAQQLWCACSILWMANERAEYGSAYGFTHFVEEKQRGHVRHGKTVTVPPV